MPFRHVAFFIKCRARGCGICSWAAGGRNCSVRFCLLHPPKLAHAAHLHIALSKCSNASPLHPKALDFTKKRTAENRTVLEMCRIYLFLSY